MAASTFFSKPTTSSPFVAPPSAASVSSVFAKSPPPVGSGALRLTGVLATPPTPAPSLLSTWRSPPPTTIPPRVGPAVAAYTPATTGASTTIPTPAQSPPAATVTGMFANLNKFGTRPAPLPPALRMTAPTPSPQVFAPTTRPGSLLTSVRSTANDVLSKIAPFNPPAPTLIRPVSPSPFLDAPTMPGAQPPMTLGRDNTQGSTGTPAGTSLPAAADVAAGVNPTSTGGGGGGGDWWTPAAVMETAAAPGANLGKIALYAGAGLGGLFLLKNLLRSS